MLEKADNSHHNRGQEDYAKGVYNPPSATMLDHLSAALSHEGNANLQQIIADRAAYFEGRENAKRQDR